MEKRREQRNLVNDGIRYDFDKIFPFNCEHKILFANKMSSVLKQLREPNKYYNVIKSKESEKFK